MHEVHACTHCHSPTQFENIETTGAAVRRLLKESPTWTEQSDDRERATEPSGER